MPVVVTSGTFRNRYPEFVDVPDPVVQLALDDAHEDTSANFFDTMHSRAIQALTAHRLAISLDEDGNAADGQPGAITAASVDGVTSNYEIPAELSGADIGFWSTTYGQTFLEIRNRNGRGPIIVL